MALIPFPKEPLRYIELRAVDRRRGLWQAYFRGDEWTPSFITTIGPRSLVVCGLRSLQDCEGLPMIEMDGEAVEVAA